jgi:hypothetical protein
MCVKNYWGTLFNNRFSAPTSGRVDFCGSEMRSWICICYGAGRLYVSDLHTHLRNTDLNNAYKSGENLLHSCTINWGSWAMKNQYFWEEICFLELSVTEASTLGILFLSLSSLRTIAETSQLIKLWVLLVTLMSFCEVTGIVCRQHMRKVWRG